MKNLLLITFFILSIRTYSQDFKIEEKSIIGVFECKDLSKSEIFSAINKWVSINYNSSKTVIQMNDLESGTIIIKGTNLLKHKNTNKIFYPNNKFVEEYSTSLLNHLVEINVKDERYRVIFKIIDIEEEGIGLNDLLFECINFKELNDNQINNYNAVMEAKLKSNLTGKKKIDAFTQMTKPSLVEINENLIGYIKSIMFLIEKSIKQKSSDEW